MSKIEHDIFYTKLTEACLNAKTDMELFIESNNFLQDLIGQCFKKLCPLEDQRMRIPDKIDKLKEIGFLTDYYALNCKTMYKVRTMYGHPIRKKDRTLMTKEERLKEAEKLCGLFTGTPASKLLKDRKSPYYEKYSEAIINTLGEIDNALYQNRNTLPLGRIPSKNELKRLGLI